MRQSALLRCTAIALLAGALTAANLTAVRIDAAPAPVFQLKQLLRQRVTGLPKSDPVQVGVYRGTIPPGGASPWHVHLYPQASYMLAGTIVLQRRDGSRIIEMHAGQANIEPAGEVMRAMNPSKNTTAVIVLFQTTTLDKPAVKTIRV